MWNLMVFSIFSQYEEVFQVELYPPLRPHLMKCKSCAPAPANIDDYAKLRTRPWHGSAWYPNFGSRFWHSVIWSMFYYGNISSTMNFINFFSVKWYYSSVWHNHALQPPAWWQVGGTKFLMNMWYFWTIYKLAKIYFPKILISHWDSWTNY